MEEFKETAGDEIILATRDRLADTLRLIQDQLLDVIENSDLTLRNEIVRDHFNAAVSTLRTVATRDDIRTAVASMRAMALADLGFITGLANQCRNELEVLESYLPNDDECGQQLIRVVIPRDGHLNHLGFLQDRIVAGKTLIQSLNADIAFCRTSNLTHLEEVHVPDDTAVLGPVNELMHLRASFLTDEAV